MRKPWIPVSRRRPSFGQPPTAGFPRSRLDGLSVVSITKRVAVAGAVIALGVLPKTARIVHPKPGLSVCQDSSTRISGAVYRSVPPRNRTSFDRAKFVQFKQVDNRRREGRVYITAPPSRRNPDNVTIIFRKPITPVSRLRPGFGQMPPAILVPQTPVSSVRPHRQAYSVSDYRRGRGAVFTFGPKRFTETPKVKPFVVRRVASPSFRGRVATIQVPRPTLLIAVPRVPVFKVAKFERRTYPGKRIFFGPVRPTTIAFRSPVIWRAHDIVIAGQTYHWMRRMPNILPPGSRPRPIKVVGRPIDFVRGRVIRFGPARPTTTQFSNRGLKVRYGGQERRPGRVFKGIRGRQNPIVIGTTNFGLIEFFNLQITLDVKREVDGGTVSCLAADSGGTTVNFNKTFKDIDSLTATPISTTRKEAIIDFVDIPNPVSFKILVFDGAGNRVDSVVSWKARGIV